MFRNCNLSTQRQCVRLERINLQLSLSIKIALSLIEIYNQHILKKNAASTKLKMNSDVSLRELKEVQWALKLPTQTWSPAKETIVTDLSSELCPESKNQNTNTLSSTDPVVSIHLSAKTIEFQSTSTLQDNLIVILMMKMGWSLGSKIVLINIISNHTLEDEDSRTRIWEQEKVMKMIYK